jgi:23S rRNA (cytidine1920-2'-O)/16S rRNA (cytidine1409-2'-O)-methyltransferase
MRRATVIDIEARALWRDLCDRDHTPDAEYAGAVPKRRLDTLLADRGLFETRTRAAAAVLAGDVRLGAHGQRAEKPGQMVPEDVRVDVADAPPFVSRGGIKLANALDELEIDPSGRRCLDVGASTGGFSDCLLQRGAAEVIALDVAYGELHWKLRQDPRVTVVERRNARSLSPGELPFEPDLVAIDVSFISLEKVLGAVLACTAPRFDCLALVKPQFEVGRERVGRGGVVRSAADRRAALVAAGEAAQRLDAAVLGYATSGLPGPAGNRESFVWLAEPGREGTVKDLETAARRAEP